MESLHIGTPPSNFNCWESKTIYVHNFLDLPTKSEYNEVYSRVFHCLGHDWGLFFCPDAHDDSNDVMVEVALLNLSSKGVTIEWGVILVKSDGSEDSVAAGEEFNFGGYNKDNSAWAVNLVKRSDLIQESSEYLLNGSLVFKVQMRLTPGKYGNRFIPEHPIEDNMEIFLDNETSDIAFDVKGEIIVAHKCIIKAQAKALYEMCETWSKEDPMPINDVNSEVFRIMLSSLYGKGVLPEEWKEHSECILNAAGKWGFDKFKSKAEEWYTNFLELTVDNVIELFLKADGNGWTAVRDVAKKFMVQHAKEVLSSKSFDLLYESKPLMKEIMTAAL
jgi:hypothetical protein